MNHRVAPTLVALAAASLLLLLWVGRGDHNADPASAMATTSRAQDVNAVGAAPAAVPVATLSPEARTLLARLKAMLSRRDVRPQELVFTFNDDAALARFLARAESSGLEILGRLDSLRAVRVRYRDLGALQRELTRHASDYSELTGNYTFTVPQPPAPEVRNATNQVPFRNGALAFIGATGDRSDWGRGVTIAILDTGIEPDPTFGSGRLRAIDIGLGLHPGATGDEGHGTSVASLAAGGAGDAPGVAPAADLLSIRVTDPDGTSDIFTLSRAIIAAVDAGAKVINVSLGGYGSSAILDAAISYAAERRAVIVASAGNDQVPQLTWPAADPRVVSVGAVDRAGQQVIFSNSGAQLQFTAPGFGVQTAWSSGQRVYVDGTSASAPIVAGAIAALISRDPSLSSSEAVQLLARTASDAGAPGPDPAYGNGILNLGWAMNAGNAAHVDTAVSSHYFDAANNQMVIVVQNRSGRSVAGLSLAVEAGTTTTSTFIPSLGPGETQVVRVPVDAGQLNVSGQIRYTTTLTNPPGNLDAVPENNRRSSVLSATVPKG